MCEGRRANWGRKDLFSLLTGDTDRDGSQLLPYAECSSLWQTGCGVADAIVEVASIFCTLGVRPNDDSVIIVPSV